MSTYAFWAAIRTVRSKVGTWVGYEGVRAAGLDVDRTSWARWIGQAQAAIANRTAELAAPLGLKPRGSEISPMETVRTRGFLQETVLHIRDRDTGIIRDQIFVIRGPTVLSRRNAVNRAKARYQAAIDNNPDDYPEEIVGAGYMGTWEMIPGG